MNSQAVSLQVSPTIGNVSAEYFVPEKAIAIVTLSHGAGAGMNHPFMVALATALAELNIGTVRFNFPFIENKKRRPDLPVAAHKTVEAAVNHAHESFPSLPLFASGKSFGARMTSQYLALHPNESVKGIIFYGFPLHPAKKPAIERAEHLKNVKTPMLFLQGTRDELATIDLIESVCSSLPEATLVKIEGADHAFKAGKQNIIQLLADSSLKWIKSVIEN